MVMAENETVRSNRLALLAELLREFTTVADFSELGGEERVRKYKVLLEVATSRRADNFPICRRGMVAVASLHNSKRTSEEHSD